MYSDSAKNILYVSQFRDSSGYASAARSYLKAVNEYLSKSKDKVNFKIFTVPIEHTNSLSTEERVLLDEYEINNRDLEEFLKLDYTMVWHMPPSMPMIGHNFVEEPVWQNVVRILQNSSRNINITVWEADRIPDSWSKNIYPSLGTESLVVPSTWNQEVFSDQISGLDCHLLPHVIEEFPISEQKSNISQRLNGKFVVFSMSQWQSRKGFDKLIQAFCMEFGENPNAVLVIKTYGNLMKSNPVSVKDQAMQIASEIKAYKDTVFISNGKQSNAEIILLPYVVPFSEISSLQRRADLFALLTRGEGFGLTIAEAISHETPVLVPDAGGHLDYIDKDSSFLVSGHWSPYVGKPEYTCDMNWYEPHISSARKLLREAYNLWKNKKLSPKGKEAKKHMKSKCLDRYSIGKRMMEIIRQASNKRQKLESIVNHDLSETSIKERVSRIKSSFDSIGDDTGDKIKLLKDSFKGEECYIITCGPSLNEYEFSKLKEKLKDKLVFTIKQSIDDFEELSSFHFFNSNNFSKFNNNGCISIGSSAEFKPIMDSNVWGGQKYDIFLKILEDKNYNETIAISNKFNEWTLDKTLKRPWGPGIMYETVFYMAEHIGVKDIYTIGWDLEEPGTVKSSHYYEKSEKDLIRPADLMKPYEIEKNIEASKEFERWLATKDINLYIATENSHVHESVKRRKI